MFFFPSWAENCAANNQTNGVDMRSGSSGVAQRRPRLARAVVMDPTIQPNMAAGLPRPFLPTLPHTDGSTGVIKSFVLPGRKTGVVRVLATSAFPSDSISFGCQMFVGSFEGDPDQFQHDVDAAINEFKGYGVTNLLIDVTNNGGSHAFLTEWRKT